MKIFLRVKAITLLAIFSVSCDVEPVGVGVWDVTTESQSGDQISVWTVTADGAISMAGETTIVVDAEVLSGSRIVWSNEVPRAENPKQLPNKSFNGSVDGNRLQGTLFTRLGNSTVRGRRR